VGKTIRICLEFNEQYFDKIAQHELKSRHFRAIVRGSKDPKKEVVKELIYQLLLDYYLENIKGGEKG